VIASGVRALVAVVAESLANQDTVAFVPKAGGPTDTSKYMWAGYAVTALVYVGYALLIRQRMARTRRGE
jgi:hypothetical protein